MQKACLFEVGGGGSEIRFLLLFSYGCLIFPFLDLYRSALRPVGPDLAQEADAARRRTCSSGLHERSIAILDHRTEGFPQ